MDYETLKTASVLISLSAGLHGVILLIALNKLFAAKKVDRRWLLILIGGVTITSVARIAHLISKTPDTKYLIFPDMILFFFGPCYYFFLKTVFSNKKKSFKLSSILLAFTPLYIHSIVLILIFWSNLSFIDELVIHVNDSGHMMHYFFGMLFIAWIHNGYFWLKGNRLLEFYKSQFGDKKVRFTATFVKYFKWWYASALFLLGTILLLFLFTEQFNYSAYHLTWIGISMGVYGIGYFLMYRPETFGDFLVDFAVKKQTTQKEKRQIEKIAEDIRKAFDEDKLYLDSEISLIALSQKLKVNTVLVSKTINICFEVGFYDLVNKYRINEFIRLAELKENERYTYFSLALKAGFSSKTTFNKYFKKFKQKTPRDYFKK